MNGSHPGKDAPALLDLVEEAVRQIAGPG